MTKDVSRTTEVLSRWPCGKILGGLILTVVLLGFFLFDPAASRFALPCYFHRWTGLYCPGCGGQRAVHALLHGHVMQAAGFNLLLVGGGVVLCAVAVVRGFRPAWRARLWPPGPWALGTAVVVCVVFGVLRNLPGTLCSWLAP